MSLFVINGKEDVAIEYLGLLTTLIGRIMMWPPYLRRQIPGTNCCLVDSKIEDLNYRLVHEGRIRVAEFNWTGWVIERFDNRLWVTGSEGMSGAPIGAAEAPKTNID